jgi:hypothetical protein
MHAPHAPSSRAPPGAGTRTGPPLRMHTIGAVVRDRRVLSLALHTQQFGRCLCVVVTCGCLVGSLNTSGCECEYSMDQGSMEDSLVRMLVIDKRSGCDAGSVASSCAHTHTHTHTPQVAEGMNTRRQACSAVAEARVHTHTHRDTHARTHARTHTPAR